VQDTLPMTADTNESSARVACPACGSERARVFFELPSVPVNSITLWPTHEQALKCPSGKIELAFCSGCGAIYNRAFDPAVLQYDSRYDNSLHFSASFQHYAEELADNLVADFGLHSKDIVEVGCGKGEFLAMLCACGGNRGVGFDPTYESGRVDTHAGQGFRVIRDFYSDAYTDEPADFVCCRHVLEHIIDPRSFLADIRRGISHRTSCGVFFEVPNALFTLSGMGVWDIIYEHCFYYSAVSLTRLFASCGFDVVKTNEAFGGQYLCLEAKPASAGRKSSGANSDDVEMLSAAVNLFEDKYRHQIQDWRNALRGLRHDGKRVVLWGAGAKGTTFLNALHDVSGLEYIVDINPHKHGLFVPGTGQKVVAPDFLQQYKPDLVVITNPNYESEIKRTVAELGVASEFRMV
jgi:SAM-dependent methyltransferase